MRPKVSKEFQWFLTHGEELNPYAGKHVAIVDEGLAAVADTAEKAYKQAKKKYPTKEPVLTYIPKGDVLIL